METSLTCFNDTFNVISKRVYSEEPSFVCNSVRFGRALECLTDMLLCLLGIGPRLVVGKACCL